MPQKSKRSNKRSNKLKKTKKQKVYVMRGCSKKNKSCKMNSRKNTSCPKCGPNCHCGPKCNCPHPCPGTCYLNRKLKGGSGCGSCGCPIAPLSLNQMNMFGGQNGGNFYKQIGPIPGPMVGAAWGSPSTGTGIKLDSNYLSPYNTLKDPQLQMSMNDAGYKTLNSKVGGRKKTIKGGGLVPQDLVNLGNNFSFNLKSAYNSLNGYKAPVDPLPYKDQLTQSPKFLF